MLATGMTLASACGGAQRTLPAASSTESDSRDAAPVAERAAANDATATATAPMIDQRGTIEGTIFLDGPLPAPTPLAASLRSPPSADCHTDALRYGRPFDVSAPGPLPDAVAAAEAHDSSMGAARERRLVVRECGFDHRQLFVTTADHVLAHREGARPCVLNAAGIAPDPALVPGSADVPLPFPAEGRYAIGVHGLPEWVQATVYVMPNRFIDQTDAHGRFRIDNVPPGQVVVHGWHPGTTEAREVVTVTAGQTTRVEFHVRPTP